MSEATVERGPGRLGLGAAVAAGDLLVVALVLGSGMLRHGVDPLSARTHAALVIGPFVLGWLVAAPLAGAYDRRRLESGRAAATAVVGAWVLAALVGAGLRATPFLPGNSPPVFVAVVVGSGLAGLAVWRAAVWLVVGRLGWA